MDLWVSGISHCELLFYWYLSFSSKVLLITGNLLGAIWGKKEVGLGITELIAREIE